ncbi:hypothetical protein PM082_012652 [Marasmius tenuissimus]|nr:hypothetical protein PM082_012652 [Marasmius tenuissimus]
MTRVSDLPLDTDVNIFEETTSVNNVGKFVWQTRKFEHDVDTNTEKGRSTGDVFWHDDKVWVYQGDEKTTKWVEYALSGSEKIWCPIKEMSNYSLNPKSKGWRQGSKWKSDVSRPKKKQRTDKGPSESSDLLRPPSVTPSSSAEPPTMS